MSKFLQLLRKNTGQSLMELVIGMGLITVIIGAIAVVTVNTLKNTQFSKNQSQATKIAQENLEGARTVKNSNFGVCLKSQVEANPPPASPVCSNWEDIWTESFGTVVGGCITNDTGCTFKLVGGCTVSTGETKPFCLRYSASESYLGRFTGRILIEDEDLLQKRVTSEVFWTDSTGRRSSNLVTIFSRF